jgi:L-fucose mutarotase/ribose pyranase (RbsD/FucU family)
VSPRNRSSRSTISSSRRRVASVWDEAVDDAQKAPPIFEPIGAAASKAEGREISVPNMERFQFNAAAKGAYAIARTAEPVRDGCFIFQRGAI